MSVVKFYVFLIIQVILCVNCHQSKSSVAFVIDRTTSMKKVINLVKEKTDFIFDAVLKSNSNRIEDFILVTFDDPGTQVVTSTTNGTVFKAALEGIKLVRGGDCPEYSMSGIEEALKISKPNSFIYVFTDASAADYEKYDVVKSLSQKKAIQVNFLLTGKCRKKEHNKYLHIYNDVSQATSGQIFNIKSHDISEIINYIIESIKNKRTILKHKTIEEKGGTIQFTVDSKIQEIMISISSNSPNYRLTDLDGNVINKTPIAHIARTAIDKFILKPGLYTIHMHTDAKCSVVVSGSTTVCFQYGFSSIEPTTLNETSTKPIKNPTGKQYLSIELDNIERDVKLESAVIRDIDDNNLLVLPLKIINVEKQFYRSEPFEPPSGMFKIAINGLTTSKEHIIRVSTSTTEYQTPILENVTFECPKVTILPSSQLNVDSEDNLTLKCKVHAYPEPKITWTDSSGAVLLSKPVLPIDLPSDYISVLEVKDVHTDIFTCTALNNKGEKDAKSIVVKRKKSIYFQILEYPKDKTVEYKETVEFKCIVNASTPATINWFRGYDKISNDRNYAISPDSSVLTIKNMIPTLQGNYRMNIVNGNETREFPFQVHLNGAEVPKIDKSTVIYYTVIGESIDLPCRVIRGKPKPVISWSFSKEESSHGFDNFESTESTLHIPGITKEDSGYYKCKAENDISEDIHEMQLIVEYLPKITMKRYIKFNQNEPVIINCLVDGLPKPIVQWTYEETEIKTSSKYYIYNNNTLKFVGSVSDSGLYYCKAKNSHGNAQKYSKVTIYEPVSIEPPTEHRLTLRIGTTKILQCHVHGYPKPTVNWIKYDMDPKVLGQKLSYNKDNSYKLDKAQITDQGYYTCSAENSGGVKAITYEVYVLVAPEIKKNKISKFIGVVGDPKLRIPCEARGSPKPIIIWQLNGLNIPKGIEDYDIAEDGALIVKKLSLSSQGVYVCIAKNSVASDKVEYELEINSSVDFDTDQVTEYILIGSSNEIFCSNTKKATGNIATDIVRWFKDGTFVKEGKLIFTNAQLSDSGVYTCRLSTSWSYFTISYNKRVVVGFKPEFTSDDRKVIEFKEGVIETLDCSANGEPKPKVRWRLNAESLEEKSMLYKFRMDKTNIGNYKCVIKNNFGEINRIFKLTNEACILPRNEYLDKHIPLFLSNKMTWILERTMPIYEKIYIICPESFLSYNKERLGKYILAKCLNTSMFEINNKIYDISVMKCDKHIEVTHRRTNKACHRGNTELIDVGYWVGSIFLNVFDVCIDKEKFKIHFTKYGLHQGVANTDIIGATFETNKLMPLKFDDIYDCKKQIKSISSSIRQRFNDSGKCCYGKRQLVNPKDVLPGLSQIATFTYLNVVPVWSSCGSENWDEVERRVRSLGASLGYALEIWTGSSHSTLLNSNKEIRLNDGNNIQQSVPLYLWKVVINRQEQRSIAIILINVPNLTTVEAYALMNCKNICDETQWMKNPEWSNVKKGFVFCCRINDFEKAFNYKNLFKSRGLVLK